MSAAVDLAPARRPTGRFPFPLPFGWFPVALADELGPGQRLQLHYLERDLELWRDEAGEPALRDGTRRWPAVERNGWVLAWYHPGGGAPLWPVPALPEHDAAGWTPYRRYRMKVRSRNQEIIENVADRAHFHFVHGTVDVPRTEFSMDGHRLRARQVTRMRTPRGVVDGGIESIYHGLGFGSVRFTGICEALMLIGMTPIDLEHLDVRFAFTLDATGGTSPDHGLGAALIADILGQFIEDIPIWESKRYREQPPLCEADGPIARYRRWAARFYVPGPGVE